MNIIILTVSMDWQSDKSKRIESTKFLDASKMDDTTMFLDAINALSKHLENEEMKLTIQQYVKKVITDSMITIDYDRFHVLDCNVIKVLWVRFE